MLPSLADQIASELEALRANSRLRSCPALEGHSRANIIFEGQPFVSFCSNDYLGLASDPRLQSAASQAAYRSGFGAGASRLVAGNLPEHMALENALAELVCLPAALLFPTGYQANLGALTALAGPDDLIVADRAIHASIIDGCRLSRAKLAIYPHLDAHTAERHLGRLGPARRRRFLVTESLFSMEGDVAPLLALSTIAAAHDAALVVDEAHALGCLGPSGRGLCAEFGVRPDVLVGTLGKAFGASGAFVAGTNELRDYILNRARSFIFTTSLPIPVAAAAHAAVQIVTSPEGDRLRARLRALALHLGSSLGLVADPHTAPIIPIMIGADQPTVEASHRLLDRGFFVQAIRPPTVREGTARLRITLSAVHTQQQVADLAASIAALPQRNQPPPSSLRLRVNPTKLEAEQRTDCLSPTHPIQGIVLLGTDTGVGKTAVATALLHILVSRGGKPVPFKPVETGAHPLPSDATRLRSASLRDDMPLDIVCPIALREPVAPAAASNGRPITLTALLAHARRAAAYGSPLVVESAGGILSPYAPNLNSADLASALAFPVLLIARNALGTVNHTALAIAEIRRRALPILGIVLVTTTAMTTPDQRSNSRLISDATGLEPLGILPFVESHTPSALAAALQANVDLRPILGSLPI